MLNKVDYLRPQEREDIVVFLRKAERCRPTHPSSVCRRVMDSRPSSRATIKKTAADIIEVPFEQSGEHVPFQLGEDPYWVTEHRTSL